MHWAAYLWPGLPHLWIEGSWAGLLLAIGFGALLNLLILATFIWPLWLTSQVKTGCAVTAGLLWVAALIETRGELRRIAARRQAQIEAELAAQQADELAENDSADEGTIEEAIDPDEELTKKLDQLFVTAQEQYLRDDAVGTEQTLLQLLRLDRDDVEAGLLLATVWRHNNRHKDARRRLRRLASREKAAPWLYEIEQELAWLDAAQNETETNDLPAESTAENVANRQPDTESSVQTGTELSNPPNLSPETPSQNGDKPSQLTISAQPVSHDSIDQTDQSRAA